MIPNNTYFDPTLPHPPTEEPPPNHPNLHTQPTQSIAHTILSQPVQSQLPVAPPLYPPYPRGQAAAPGRYYQNLHPALDPILPTLVPYALSQRATSPAFSQTSSLATRNTENHFAMPSSSMSSSSSSSSSYRPTSFLSSSPTLQSSSSSSYRPTSFLSSSSYSSSSPTIQRSSVSALYPSNSPALSNINNYSASRIRQTPIWEPRARREHSTCCKLIAAVVLVIFTRMALDMFFSSVR